MALERKVAANVEHYGGPVKLLTLTPPGQELCPWGDEGRVEWIYAEVWNRTSQARASRLFEAAQRSADRLVRRLFGGSRLPRQVGNAWGWQQRGLKHWHWLLPMGSEVERAWSRQVERYMDRAWREEKRRWSDEERSALLWSEYAGKGAPRGFYGFGYVHGGSRHGRSSARASRYLAKNAAGYVAGQRGGHYISTRLTRETGVTMRALRACNWLYVRRRLIEEGTLLDEWIPGHWSAEWQETVLRVWGLVVAPGAP